MTSITPSMIGDFFLAASQRDDTKVINYLGQYGTPLAQAFGALEHNFKTIDYTGFGNALHHTICGQIIKIEQLMDDRIDRIVSELIKYKCDVNQKMKLNQQTPLHCVCDDTKEGSELLKYTLYHPDMDIEEVKQLIEKRIKDNEAPKLKIAEMLLQAGAKASIPDLRGDLPIDLISDPDFKAKMDALFKKYQPNYVEESKSLLPEQGKWMKMIAGTKLDDPKMIRDSGADPNMSIENCPLLIYTILEKKEEAFLTLINLGADSKSTYQYDEEENVDGFELLPLYFSAKIFRKYLDLHFDPNRTSIVSEKSTALVHFSKVLWHQYALRGNVRAIEILVARQISLDMDTKVEGRSILDLLKSDALKNNPFLRERMSEFEQVNKDSLITNVLVKIIDQNPHWVQPMDPFVNQLHNRGVNDLPKELKEMFNEAPNLDDIAEEYFSLVSSASYSLVSYGIRELFKEYEQMKSLIEGVNDNHRQIIQLLERNRPRQGNRMDKLMQGFQVLNSYCSLI